MASSILAKGKPSDLDVLSKMGEATWRGIKFFATSISLEISHDQAQHLYPDRDAGIIEATGRKPAMHSFQALFRNGIFGWKEQPYPTAFRRFTAAFADKTTGELVHPELGLLKVKPVSCRVAWESMTRDGANCDVQFIEASDLEGDLLKALSADGTLAYSAARDLDKAIADVSPIPELPESLRPSLLDSLNQINGLLQSVKFGVGNVTAQLDAFTSGIAQLRDTISDLDNPANYQAIEACDALFSALYDLAETATKKARPTTFKVVSRDMDISSAASDVGNSVDDFVALNPALASRTTVRSGTTVLAYIA